MDGHTAFASTVLTTAVDSDDTVYVVSSTRGFAGAPNYIILDNEVTVYSSSNDTAFMGLSRGATHPSYNEISLAAAHAAGTPVRSMEASVLDSLLGFNINAVSTTYGTFSLLDFGTAVWSFFKNIPRLLLFDYAFLKGPYNPTTGQNDLTDIILVRLGLICIFTIPGFVALILLTRSLITGGGV